MLRVPPTRPPSYVAEPVSCGVCHHGRALRLGRHQDSPGARAPADPPPQPHTYSVRHVQRVPLGPAARGLGPRSLESSPSGDSRFTCLSRDHTGSLPSPLGVLPLKACSACPEHEEAPAPSAAGTGVTGQGLMVSRQRASYTRFLEARKEVAQGSHASLPRQALPTLGILKPPKPPSALAKCRERTPAFSLMASAEEGCPGTRPNPHRTHAGGREAGGQTVLQAGGSLTCTMKAPGLNSLQHKQQQDAGVEVEGSTVLPPPLPVLAERGTGMLTLMVSPRFFPVKILGAPKGGLSLPAGVEEPGGCFLLEAGKVKSRRKRRKGVPAVPWP